MRINQHIKESHVHSCNNCTKFFTDFNELEEHKQTHKPSTQPQEGSRRKQKLLAIKDSKKVEFADL